MSQKSINYKNDFPLSNYDLEQFISQVDPNGVNIVDITKIKPNMDIETVYDNRGHCVFFVPPNSGGHWVCTLRNRDGEIYFIDSFAETPDYYSDSVMKFFENNHNKGKIKYLHINDEVLQEPDSQTCGRYCIILISLHKMGLPPSVMIDYLKDGGKKYGSIDNFIIELTKNL
jgi:hypothetical protein